MPALKSIVSIVSALVVTLLLASACETAPPVQEMSDARQAIAVAKEAGAADLAAAELNQAEQYLESAQQNINERDYAGARQDAIEARNKARSALEMSESTQDDGNQ